MPRKTAKPRTRARARQPIRMSARVDVWRCDDLRALIKKQINAHVKDVRVAKRLEEALAVEIAYNDGGGDPIAIT